MITEVNDYKFKVRDLNIEKRTKGISMFIRTRNGEDFLEEVVETNIDFLDELVVVYNRCTDSTEKILKKLMKKHKKLKVFNYVPKVYPPGSNKHIELPPDSKNSLVNYYNFALAQTTKTIVAKLDDDHIGLSKGLKKITNAIKEKDYEIGKEMLCFSGLNLTSEDGKIGILKNNIFSGNGDIGFFKVNPETYFIHSPKFEVLNKVLKRKYYDLAYIHTKYLKKEKGFYVYDLEENPDSRYHKQKEKAQSSKEILEPQGLLDFYATHRFFAKMFSWLPIPDKGALQRDRLALLDKQYDYKIIEKWINDYSKQ